MNRLGLVLLLCLLAELGDVAVSPAVQGIVAVALVVMTAALFFRAYPPGRRLRPGAILISAVGVWALSALQPRPSDVERLGTFALFLLLAWRSNAPAAMEVRPRAVHAASPRTGCGCEAAG